VGSERFSVGTRVSVSVRANTIDGLLTSQIVCIANVKHLFEESAFKCLVTLTRYIQNLSELRFAVQVA